MGSCFPTCTHLPSRSCHHRPYLLQPSEPWSQPRSVPSRQRRNSGGSVWSAHGTISQPLTVHAPLQKLCSIHKIMPWLLTWAPPPRCIRSCLGPEQQTAFSCLPRIIQSFPLVQRRSWSRMCLELHRRRGGDETEGAQMWEWGVSWRERREIEEEKSHLLTVHFKYYHSVMDDIHHLRQPAAQHSLLPVLAWWHDAVQ